MNPSHRTFRCAPAASLAGLTVTLRTPALLTVILLIASCASQPPNFDVLSFGDYQILDLTHTFDQHTLYWPAAKVFQHDRVAWGISEQGHWYSSYDYAASEHGGTHLDAPIHFAEGKRGVAAIPVEQLMGPAVVIDVSASCRDDTDYLVSPADIDHHERQHGPIAPGSAVLLHTGWSAYWPGANHRPSANYRSNASDGPEANPRPGAKQYLGSDTPGDTENLHFPGLSPEAAEALVQRRVSIVGIDTASIDRGLSRDFRAHQILAAAEIAILENVAGTANLPAAGALLIALPMKIGQGSGAPCRIIALLPRQS